MMLGWREVTSIRKEFQYFSNLLFFRKSRSKMIRICGKVLSNLKVYHISNVFGYCHWTTKILGSLKVTMRWCWVLFPSSASHKYSLPSSRCFVEYNQRYLWHFPCGGLLKIGYMIIHDVPQQSAQDTNLVDTCGDNIHFELFFKPTKKK